MQAAPNLSEKLDVAMQAGAKAVSERRWDEAQRYYKEAVRLGEQLQPHDPRLVTALDHLGNQYVGVDFAAADAAYGRELKVIEELYGPQSAMMAQAFESLGTSALMQHDYDSAHKFYSRGVEVNQKTFGETSKQVADSLTILTRVYLMQKAYDKAEPYLLRAVKIDESLFGREAVVLLMPLGTLCSLYDNWEKPDRSEPCDRQLLTILEKQFGENSPQLVSTLASEAKALRSLGRTEEAAQVEKRLESIQAAMIKPN